GAFLFLRLRADLVSGIDDSLDARTAQISLSLQGPDDGELQDLSEATAGGLVRGEGPAQRLSPDGALAQRAGDQLGPQPLAAGAAARALAGMVGWLLARRALVPVARMTTQAAAIGGDRLGDRVSVPPAADELSRLAMTLNGMLDRLERGVRQQRRLVADASHE